MLGERTLSASPNARVRRGDSSEVKEGFGDGSAGGTRFPILTGLSFSDDPDARAVNVEVGVGDLKVL